MSDSQGEPSTSKRQKSQKELEDLLLFNTEELEDGLEDFDESLLMDFDNESDSEEILMNDDELTNMLDSTKEARALLKTGGLEEIGADFADFQDNLIASSGFKKKAKKGARATKGEARIPEAVKELLGHANNLYINRDYGRAIDLLQETITKYPNIHQPWNTLGLVHEEMGNYEKALQVRMVAAHMSGNDANLWKELGLKSIENNANQQAIYCFNKALVLDPLDVDALWDRSFLQKEMGLVTAAMDGFTQILDILPYHFKVINELAQLYRIQGETKKAIKLYEEAMEYHINQQQQKEEKGISDGQRQLQQMNDFDIFGDDDDDDVNENEMDHIGQPKQLQQHPFSDTLGYSEINMLSELYLMLNDYRRALDCIKTGIRHVQKRQFQLKWLNRPDDDDEYLPKKQRLDNSKKKKKQQKMIRRSKRNIKRSNSISETAMVDDGENQLLKKKKKKTKEDDDSDDDDSDYNNDNDYVDDDSDDDVYDEESEVDDALSNEDDDDDDDDDDNDQEDEEDNDRFNIPMELRVRMGICRIYLGQPKVAARHFEYLYQHTPKAYPDLYQDVAYAYMDRRFYETALPLFQKIINAEDEVEVELLIKTADCYRQVGDFDTAVIFYVNVLDEQPENLEVMTSLALVYEQQGKEDEAFELANFVVEKTRELRKQKRMEALALKKNKEQQQHNDNNNNDNDEDIMDEDDDRMESTNDIATEATKRLQFTSSKKQASLFDENKHDKRLQKNSLREKLRREEELKQFKALDLYETIVNLDQSLNDEIIHTDRNVMRDYIYAAQQLWSDFSSVSAFFDSKKFKKENPDGGFFAARKSIRKIFFSSREAKSVTTRLNKKRDRNTQNNTNLDSDEDEDDEDEDDVTEEESSSKKDITQTIHFRNILIDDYVRIFINLCYMLTVLYRGDEAINILRTLAESKVVYFHEKRSQYIMLALLGCSILHKDKRNALIACRWFCNAFKFKKEGYKIYNASFNSGWEDKLSYASATAFKFFSRHVKLMDKLYILYQKQLISNATDGNEEEARKQIEQLKKDIETLNSESMNVNDNDNEDNLLGLFEKGNKSNGLEDSKPLERLDTYLLTLYGHVMAIGKNYVNSIAFYLRTYAIAPENPLNTLCLGIAHLQRSTQRKTDNRHLQVIKGMNMFSNYCKLRNYNQEAEYNMGRAFHLIGITHLAVRHYERALSLPSAAKEGIKKPTPIEDIYVWPISEEEEDNGDDEEYDPTDLKYEAAYNLHLIYMTSGATALAQIVLLKYCTI